MTALSKCTWIAAALAVFVPNVDAQRGGRSNSDQVWKFFSERHDKNKDGSITQKEYARGAERFASLDRNGDGAVTREDFEGGMRRRRGNRGRNSSNTGQMMRFLIKADTDGDRSVTRVEWDAFYPKRLEGDNVNIPASFVRALDADKSGMLSKKELAALFDRFDGNRDGKVTRAEMMGRTQSRVPQRGEIAPDFILPYVGKIKTAEKGEKTVRLSSFRGKRPVALIFGSYT